jgi:hypothetical protein
MTLNRISVTFVGRYAVSARVALGSAALCCKERILFVGLKRVGLSAVAGRL